MAMGRETCGTRLRSLIAKPGSGFIGEAPVSFMQLQRGMLRLGNRLGNIPVEVSRVSCDNMKAKHAV